MHPNIIVGNVIIPGWYAMVVLGAVVATGLGIFCGPNSFALNRKALAGLAVILIIAGLLGGRILFLILHGAEAGLGIEDLFSPRGGFAYFGALILSIIALWVYTALKRVSFLAIADYSLPFLMLSQVFVRIGCLMAGCCYGKPTDMICGFVFKPVDGVMRHPTQGYEALLLLAIYVVSRLIYNKKESLRGYTFLTALILYGSGRFFIEFLRTDSIVIFLNLTLAQISCLALALAAFLAKLSIKSSISS